MDTQLSSEMHLKKWSTWFPGVPEQELSRSFATWQILDRRRAAMQAVLAKTTLLPSASGKVKKASRRLDYEQPYRIVVLGETGAGKSTIVNAILAQNRLVTGAGGAITGVPVYVHPISNTQDERVLVNYRTDREFHILVQGMTQTFGFELPSSRIEISSTYRDVVAQSSTGNDETGKRLLDALSDILDVWRRLEEKGQLGKVETFHPERDREWLQQLMEEKSRINALGSDKRVIPGISRIEYFVQVNSPQHTDGALQSNIVFVDTPGVWAQTLRHQAILRQETLEADAVILVVGARRPEEKSASMAHLLEQALLSSYSPEQKDRFSQKVFLVVNQMDAIQSVDDQSRLRESVDSLCDIISSTFSARHVYSDSDVRYFKTVAQLAVLAEEKTQTGKLSEGDDAVYRARLEQLLSQEERNASEVDSVALSRSGVPALTDALDKFLGAKRLQLMLEEASALLGQVPRDAETESQAFFIRYGLILDDTMSLDTLSERNTRQLCNKQLERDREAMQNNCNSMLERAQQWRISPEYKQSLREKTDDICTTLDQRMGDWVSKELPVWLMQTPNPVDGRIVMELHIRSFLILAEQKLRGFAEDEAQHLADYYLSHFDELLKSYRIYERIVEKSYDQTYIGQRVHPVPTLQEVQADIGKEFSEICRWVLIYELLRNPTLGPDDEPESQIPRIAKEVALQLAQVALDMSITTASPAATISFKAAGSAISKWIRQDSASKQPNEEPVSKIPANTDDQKREQQRADDFKKVREAIQSALEKRDQPRLQKIITDELSKRNKLALSKSLPYLDMLFFYQIDKFHQEYQAKVDELCQEHLDQVADRNVSIRDILVRKNDVTLLQAGELMRVLTELKQVA